MTEYYVDENGIDKGGFSEGNPAIDPSWTKVSGPPPKGGMAWTGLDWVDSKDALKAYLADYRWKKETGGVIVGGLPIATDDRSKLLINGAYNKALEENNPAAVKAFKSTAGFIDVTNGTIVTVALAVAKHVQDGYTAEKATSEAIDAGTVINKAQVEATFDNEYDLLQ